MAELGLREQLQPALLDRLLDDERFVTLIQVCARGAELERLRLKSGELADILKARGLKPLPAQPGQGVKPEPDELEFWFSSPGRSVGLQQIKESMVRPPGAPGGASLQSFCRIHAHAVLNVHTEALERGSFNMRRLRESVFRDVRWLLNSMSLDTTEELSRYPHVERSVLNYGMPALAGKAMSSIDPRLTAERIALAIRTFEPRLSKVRVTPEKREMGNHEFALEFKIEAELWGQPVPQQLTMSTRIDLDTGQVSLGEGSGR
ncbi:MAG TPA: type VI secretion system baseplate subunit TssE [Steroidobacteraceae bacterium]|jgi:type VI secretion system protein ImpF|nr:type VI secretion system baseplate subunit TssE [Steroidobacteraceae bacterium]